MAAACDVLPTVTGLNSNLSDFVVSACAADEMQFDDRPGRPCPERHAMTGDTASDHDGEDRLFEQRVEKLQRLRASGIDPYPARFSRADLAADALGSFDGEPGKQVRVAGRIIGGIRRFGGLTFLHLQDVSGRIQIAIKRDVVGADRYTFLHEVLDAGDFLGVVGTTFKTRTGEITVE